MRYVDVTGARRESGHLPDFLILGPQRTGTTWLARNLWRHPEVFMTFPKEVYFFNLLKTPEHRLFRSRSLKWYQRRFRDNPTGYVYKSARSLVRSRVRYRPLVRGEATASYAAMEPDLIDEVVELNPDIRGIMMVRDPAARAWSHAKMHLTHVERRRLADITDQEFIDFFRDDYQIACGTYSKIVENWTNVLKPGNLYIGDFNDIATRPIDVLGSVCRFIGVSDNPQYFTGTLNAKVNATHESRVPEKFRLVLDDMFGPQNRTDMGLPLTPSTNGPNA